MRAALMGGGHRPYGGRAGPNFDRLYHKANSHNSTVSMQKNRGDKSHRRIIDPTLVISIVVALIFQ